MNCSCRASSLRLFVRGLAQVHSAEPLALRTLQRPPAYRVLDAPRAAFSTTPFARDDTVGKSAQAHDGQNPTFNVATEPSTDTISKSTEEAKDLTWTIDPSPDASTRRDSPRNKSTRPKHQGPKRRSKKTDIQEGDNLFAEDSFAPWNKKTPFRAKKAPSDDTKAPTEPVYFPEPQHRRENWQLQKDALKKKFPEGWKPMKRLSPDAVAGIRALHAQFPEEYTTAKLVEKFEVSPEAVRRILKSKWTPSPEEEEERQTRWFRRGKDVWARYAELGMKPPQKWRAEGVARDPSYHDKRQAAIARRKEEEAKEDAGARLQRKMGGGFL
ncbi:hypothetical protein ACHAQA_007304 [Verticillium albo-atrum]